MSKIVKLTSENIKRLHAVEITPEGNVVVIKGKNGQGKTSVIDSIEYALGGDPSDRMPVRRGEAKAKVIVDLGDIVVKRTFTAGGGTALMVTDADGVKQTSPQAILDRLVGRLTFDPLNFARQKPPQQAETLRTLLNLDFAASDKEREKVFNDRTTVNRDAKGLETRISAIPKVDGLPAQEESAAAILVEQETAAAGNQANADQRLKLQTLKEAQEGRKNDLTATEQEIKDVEAKLVKIREDRDQLVIWVSENATLIEREEKAVAQLKDSDLTQFQTKISQVETQNRKIREQKQRAELVTQYKTKTAEAERLSTKIEELDSNKRKATTEAKYPIEGLMFDAAGGVTFNGIPFEQCSAAEQLKVSVSIGIALNPKLKVILIRDGSLLDTESMAVLCEMAKTADAQIWIERVQGDGETGVLIEDGRVIAEKHADGEQPELV